MTMQTAAAPIAPIAPIAITKSNGAVQVQVQETPEQELQRLRAENERLKAQSKSVGRLSLKVSEKGAVSVYGLGRFPVTLYGEQWERLLGQADEIRAFLKAHQAELSTKN